MSSKMDAKMKSCFTPHSMMHSLVGLGVGLFLAGLIPGLAINGVWLGLVIIVVAVFLDYNRKDAK